MSKMKLQAKSKLAALNKELEEAKRVAADVVERVCTRVIYFSLSDMHSVNTIYMYHRCHFFYLFRNSN